MAVMSSNELLDKVRNRFGEDMSDEDFELVADITDTLTANENENWKQKYEENDNAWRKKYRDRFNSGVPDSQDNEPESSKTPKTYNDLFKEV